MSNDEPNDKETVMVWLPESACRVLDATATREQKTIDELVAGAMDKFLPQSGSMGSIRILKEMENSKPLTLTLPCALVERFASAATGTVHSKEFLIRKAIGNHLIVQPNFV
jgi:hypothetical protein